MHIKKTAIAVALGAVFGVATMSVHAATLNTGDILTINPGVQSFDPNNNPLNVTVSWFGMDTDNNSKIAGTEKTPLTQGPDGGIIIGSAQDTNGHVSHSGPPHANTGGITNEWSFFGNAGMDFTTVPVTGGTTGLNLSGWTVTWNGIPSINMGGGAWGTGYTNGTANFVWSGVYGTGYTLDYHATVPAGDPSGFGGVKYALHLEGVVNAAPTAPIPVPAAVWLLGSGLLGLVGVARRKKA